MALTRFALFFLLASFITGFYACVETIDIDLNSAAPRLVVEGIVNNGPGPYYVRLSKTVNFDEPNDFPPVSGALVIISDDAGNADTLTELSSFPGLYESHTLLGTPGRTYYLEITAENQLYTSRSEMPAAIPLDTLSYYSTNSVNGANILVVPVYQDIAGETDYYRFVEYVNGWKRNKIFLKNDNGYDGVINQRPLFAVGNKIEPGDTVMVEMQHISQDVYAYFHGLSQQGSSSLNQSATPSNPPSNIDGENVIGYFSAFSVDYCTVIVQ